MIAVALGRVEGASLATIDQYRTEERAKVETLSRLLCAKHGPGVTMHTVEQDMTGGGVIVRVEWRPET